MEGYTEVFAWGGDHFGQLGLGNKHSGKTYSSPRFCSFNILIKELACGEEHSAFISASGHVYSMGSNSEGRLGLNDKSLRSSPSPCLVEGLSNYRCVKISCGWGHSAVVTEDGQVFTWGVGEFGALGSGSKESVWSPVKVLLPRSMRGLDVSCGSRHTALVVEENRNKGLLVCGSGEAGQLGTGRREKEFSFVAVLFNEDVAQAACGVFHTLALGANGKLYATGGNSFGQLGLGNKKSCSRFERVQIEGYVVKVAAGSHSAAITDKGSLFIWGTGVFGEYLLPTRMSVGTVKDVSIGGSFGVALELNGGVFAWGANANGELGNGDFDPKIAPTLITSLRGKTVKRLSCGGNYVLALGLDLANDFKLDYNPSLEPEIRPQRRESSQKYRTSSLEVEKRSVETRKNEFREQENFRAGEFEKLMSSYKALSQRLEETKLEVSRVNEKNLQYRSEAQRLQREVDDLRRTTEYSAKENSVLYLRTSLEDAQRQNLILTQELNSYKDAQRQNLALTQELNSYKDAQRQNIILTQELNSYKDETHRLQRALEDMKLNKHEISLQFEEINSSVIYKHQSEIQELRMSQDQEVSRRKQLEKSLDASEKHIMILEEALKKSAQDCSDAKRQLQDRSREYDSYKTSLQQEIEKYYKENNDLKRKIELAHSEKQRTESLMRSELTNFTSDCTELQIKLEKLDLEKEKISILWKADNEKHQQESSDHRRKIESLSSENDQLLRLNEKLQHDSSESRRKIEILSVEKEKTVKTLQTEIYNLGIEIDNLRLHLDKISSENQHMSQLLSQKGVEVKHCDEDIAALKTEISYYKQANEDLKYQLSKSQQQLSESVKKIDLKREELINWEENYKQLLEENSVLKESVTELENKNRQLFDNLEKELAQRAKEYKERTILMLNTPNRSTSPYLRPTTPMTHMRDKSDDMGNAASRLLDVMDSPGNGKSSQYLTISQVYKGSITPTKDDVRVRIASLMKNRVRIEEQIQSLNHD